MDIPAPAAGRRRQARAEPQSKSVYSHETRKDSEQLHRLLPWWCWLARPALAVLPSCPAPCPHLAEVHALPHPASTCPLHWCLLEGFFPWSSHISDYILKGNLAAVLEMENKHGGGKEKVPTQTNENKARYETREALDAAGPCPEASDPLRPEGHCRAQSHLRLRPRSHSSVLAHWVLGPNHTLILGPVTP